MVIIRYCFNLACFSAALGMTVYWLYKYAKNEDLVQINLRPFNTFSEGQYPMLSFCLINPFIDPGLRYLNATITKDAYDDIWMGEGPNKILAEKEFDNATLDLKDFYLQDEIRFLNGTFVSGTNPNFLNELPRVTYSGWLDILFVKCFGLGFNYTNVRFAGFGFNSSVFPDGIRSKANLMVQVHLPNQFLMAGNSGKFSWQKRENKGGYFMSFTLQEVEILKKRNKIVDPCMHDGLNHDEIVLNDHLDNVGCKAPYQKTIKKRKTCGIKEDLEKARYDASSFKHSKTACRSAATITYTYDEQDNDDIAPDMFYVWIIYPDRYKEIAMVRAVDLQAAIGNAGGYIGLFLGKVTLNSDQVFATMIKCKL